MAEEDREPGRILECSGVILAGGRSVRYGSDKALAAYRGRPLIGWAAESLRPLCAELIGVAGSEEAPAWASFVDRLAADAADLPGGPVRGLVAGLRACVTPFAFVLACDSPLVQGSLLRLLWEQASPGVEAVVPRWDGRLQPLVALYRTSAADRLEQALVEGDAAARRAVSRLAMVEVPEEQCAVVDAEGLSFLNINEERDLAVLEGRRG